jgi:urate oxidase
MKRAPRTKRTSEMLNEYDFRAGVRGKFAKRYADGTNLVVLAPDVAAVFPNAAAVNEALRALVRIARKTGKKAPA